MLVQNLTTCCSQCLGLWGLGFGTCIIYQQPQHQSGRWILIAWFQHLRVMRHFWEPVSSSLACCYGNESTFLCFISKTAFESSWHSWPANRSLRGDRWNFLAWFQHLLTVHTQFWDPVFSSVNVAEETIALFEELSLIVTDARVRPATPWVYRQVNFCRFLPAPAYRRNVFWDPIVSSPTSC